jgi:pyruvate formate lyase activating enzyme
VIFTEYAIDVAKACHNLGIKTVAVTAGYITEEARQDLYQHMDAVNVDLKSFSEEFYQKITLSHLTPVLETLKYIKHQTSVWMEITNLIIPTENDSESELNAMCEWIVSELGADVPIHFSAFHPDFKMMSHPSTPKATLSKARNIALSKGIKYVYTGNVQDRAGDTTFCNSCGEILIERDWYELKQYKLVDQNKCPVCHTVCAGVFDQSPGTWGRKRVPIRLNK